MVSPPKGSKIGLELKSLRKQEVCWALAGLRTDHHQDRELRLSQADRMVGSGNWQGLSPPHPATEHLG